MSNKYLQLVQEALAERAASPADCAGRIRQALVNACHVKGWRGLNGEQGHVELVAGDVATLLLALDPAGHTPIVQGQLQGCVAAMGTPPYLKPETKVVIYSDHAFHLLDVAAAQKITPPG